MCVSDVHVCMQMSWNAKCLEMQKNANCLEIQNVLGRRMYIFSSLHYHREKMACEVIQALKRL